MGHHLGVRELSASGSGPMAAHVFARSLKSQAVSANKHQLWNTASWGFTDRTAITTLGYQRLGPARKSRLKKNLSYHAWRTACKSTTDPMRLRAFTSKGGFAPEPCARALEHPAQDLETMWMNVACAASHLIGKFCSRTNCP